MTAEIKSGKKVVGDLQRLEKSGSARRARLSVRNKIIFSFLFVALAPIGIIGSFSYFCSKNMVIRKTANYSLDMLNQTVANIQLKLAEFESISVRLFINKDFNGALADYVKPKTVSGGVKRKNIEDYFNEYMISNKDIFAFMFISDSDHGKSIIIAKDYYNDFHNLSEDFRKTHSYQSIMTAAGGIVWSNTLKIHRNHFVVLGRYIKDATSGEPLGILAIVVDEERIDQLANLTLYNKLNISLGNMERFALIINNDGEIISSPFKQDIGKNIETLMKDTKPLKPIMEYAGDRDYGSEINQGSYVTLVNNQPTLVTFKSIGSKIGIGGRSGWHLIGLAPTSFLYDGLRRIELATWILAAIFGGLAAILSFYVAALVDRVVSCEWTVDRRE
jgi:hypothetical protein